MAWLVSADPNKHYVESSVAERIHFGSLQFRDFSENGPVGFSARVRRQLKSGPNNFFIHDTDTEDESGPLGAWEAGKSIFQPFGVICRFAVFGTKVAILFHVQSSFQLY